MCAPEDVEEVALSMSTPDPLIGFGTLPVADQLLASIGILDLNHGGR